MRVADTTGGSTGGGGGGAMGGGGSSDASTTTGQARTKAIDAARNSVANSLKSGGTVGATSSQTDALGRPIGGSSMGSFPATSTPASNPKNPTLWMGSESPIGFMNYTQAQQMYFMWDQRTKNKFLSQLNLAGYDTTQMRDADIAKLWGDYVTVAAQYQTNGKQVSPWDVLGKDIAQRSQQASQPKTTTQTQQAYNISTAEDAAALFQGAAQTLLGRDPTKAEQARFKSILNKYEQGHPATTTTTTTSVGSDVTNQSSTTTGGVSSATQQYIAEEEAKKNPEYGAYQAATNGMNWLMQMLGG